jgi:hypothetical protein
MAAKTRPAAELGVASVAGWWRGRAGARARGGSVARYIGAWTPKSPGRARPGVRRWRRRGGLGLWPMGLARAGWTGAGRAFELGLLG